MRLSRNGSLRYLVGRDEGMEVFRRCLREEGTRRIIDVEGVQGTGKTTFLKLLYHDVPQDGGYLPVWVDLAPFDPAAEGGGDPPPHESYEKYKLLLEALSDAMPQEAFAGFDEAAGELRLELDLGGGDVRGGDVKARLLGRVEAGRIDTGPKIHVPAELVLGQARTDLTMRFLEGAREVGKRHRCVVLADDGHRIMGRPVGRWFFEDVVPQLRNSVVVVARAKSPLELPGCSDAIHVDLGNFSVADVRRYLQIRLGDFAELEQLASRIFQFSGGHPQVVSIAVDRIQQHGRDRDDVLHLFDRMPAERGAQLRELVEQILDEVDEPGVRKALEAGWIARRLDAGLLCRLMEDDESVCRGREALARSAKIVRALLAYSFTEALPLSRDDEPRAYKFSEFIRREKEEELRSSDLDWYKELNRRAARYYAEWLTEYEANQADSTPYRRSYRYERPEWQAMKVEWLFHLSHLPDRDAAGVAFARVYLDAFRWWGWYRDWEFCARLLKEWSETQRGQRDREWLGALVAFHQAYPRGWKKAGREAEWRRTEEALLYMRELAGFEEERDDLPSDDHAQVRAATSLFLAHASRYLRPHDEAAERYYADARSIYGAAAEGAWMLPWIDFRLGDLFLARERFEDALRQAGKALDAARAGPDKERDYEVIANALRLQGDTRWGKGDRDAALPDYARALFAALVFQARPGPPDEYTRDVYREMSERTLARLSELWKQDAAASLAAAARLEDFWAVWHALDPGSGEDSPIERLLAEGRTAELGRALFPPEPADDELGVAGSPYVRRVVRLARELGASLEGDG